jgi:hypothetical protein
MESSAEETNRLLEGNDSGNETLTFNIAGVVFETYRYIFCVFHENLLIVRSLS